MCVRAPRSTDYQGKSPDIIPSARRAFQPLSPDTTSLSSTSSRTRARLSICESSLRGALSERCIIQLDVPFSVDGRGHRCGDAADGCRRPVPARVSDGVLRRTGTTRIRDQVAPLFVVPVPELRRDPRQSVRRPLGEVPGDVRFATFTAPLAKAPLRDVHSPTSRRSQPHFATFTAPLRDVHSPTSRRSQPHFATFTVHSPRAAGAARCRPPTAS